MGNEVFGADPPRGRWRCRLPVMESLPASISKTTMELTVGVDRHGGGGGVPGSQGSGQAAAQGSPFGSLGYMMPLPAHGYWHLKCG